MSRKKVRMIKKILGAYLVVVGILLSIDVYDQKPNNMQVIFVVASIMIIVGFLYLIQDIRKALEKYITERAEQKAKIQEEERIRRHQELHSSDKFRTAPMPVVKPLKMENIEENLEEFDEKTIIITNYEEEKLAEEKKALKEKKADKEKKIQEASDKPKKSEDIQEPATDIAEKKVTDKEKTEDLAIQVEAEEKKDNEENANADEEEN